MKNLDIIRKQIENKSVALVGNSQKVLGKKFDVDKHDIVIRMNGAWKLPDAMQASVGNKLDILCISGHKKEINQVVSEVSQVIWMSPKSRDELTQETTNQLFFYPVDWWTELNENIGARPSTGCMAVDMVRRMLGDGDLTLYGFDFFANPSWHKKYTLMERIKLWMGKEIYVNPHNGASEAEFIKNCLPKEQFRIERP